jgi:hypothetical protein
MAIVSRGFPTMTATRIQLADPGEFLAGGRKIVLGKTFVVFIVPFGRQLLVHHSHIVMRTQVSPSSNMFTLTA